MKLFAKKPCSFNGNKFFIGEEIPAELVLDAKQQEMMGVITIADDDSAVECTPHTGVVTFGVPVHSADGDISLSVTNDELTVFTDILQIGVKTAEEKQKISDMVQNINSEDLLIMLSALDGRKFVKEAAEERAKALNLIGDDK